MRKVLNLAFPHCETQIIYFGKRLTFCIRGFRELCGRALAKSGTTQNIFSEKNQMDIGHFSPCESWIGGHSAFA